MPSELGGHGADRAREGLELRRPERTPEQERAYVEGVRQAMDEAWKKEQADSWKAAEARGLTKEQWQQYERIGEEDSWRAGRIEQSQYRLREGPPNFEGTRAVTDTEKQAYVEKYQAQQNEALEHFRSEPVGGGENKPVDPERTRRWVHCREGDPVIESGGLNRRDHLVYFLSDRKGAGHPPSGLAGADAVPDASHSAEVRAERIEQGRERAAEVVGRPNWSNAKYAGEVFYDKLSPDLKERFPDGVRFTYEGFPDFSRYAVKTVRFEDGFVPPRPDGSPDRTGDNRRANAIFGWSKDPPGMTWHHVEDSRSMHLVDTKLHNWVRHWGGISIGKRNEETNADS